MDNLENLKEKIITIGKSNVFVEKKEDFKIDEKGKNPQVIYEWIAPLRPYRKFSFIVLRFYLALAILFSLLFYILGAYTLIIPTWTILFLFFVLMITPPPQIKNRITIFGIETADLSVRWEFLSHFYTDEYLGFFIINIVSFPPYNFRISLVANNEKEKNEIVKHLSSFIFYKQEREKSLIEKMAYFISRFIFEQEKVKSEKAASS